MPNVTSNRGLHFESVVYGLEIFLSMRYINSHFTYLRVP